MPYRRRVTYEYILIDGLNDEPRFAKELAGLLKGRLCHVKLIPFNAVSELNFRPSPQEKVKLFKNILTDAEKGIVHADWAMILLQLAVNLEINTVGRETRGEEFAS